MKPILILLRGVQLGLFFGFIVSAIQSYFTHDIHDVGWLFLYSGLSFFFVKYFLDKVDANSKKHVDKKEILARMELILLIGNILMFVFASWFILATFNRHWHVDDARFISLALGLPNLAALISWKVVKDKKTV